MPGKMFSRLAAVVVLTFSGTSFAEQEGPLFGVRSTVSFMACSKDRHVISTHIALVDASPFDTDLPEGHSWANKEEVEQAAQFAFELNFLPLISQSSDRVAQDPSFFQTLANQQVKVETEDENGKPIEATVTLVLKTILDFKAELMKTKKYAGLTVKYLETTVEVYPNLSCTF